MSTINLDKQAIRQSVEKALAGRLEAQPINITRADGSPTANALREQAAFLAGAMAALHAVFGESETTLTDYAPPSWIIESMRGNLVTHPQKER